MTLCECGCGQQTAIATMTSTRFGHVKGRPHRFVKYHSKRNAHLPLHTRLKRHIDVRSPDECWPWTGSRSRDGYGTVNVDGRSLLAHRVAWEDFYGVKIPEEMKVLHRCDNPPCCNVEQCLFIGTQLDNMRDMERKGRGSVHRGQPPGEKHPMSKLSDADALAIREDYAKNRTPMRLIAKTYGVSQSVIALTISGKRRAHLPMLQAHARQDQLTITEPRPR